MRLRALGGLRFYPSDARAIAALEQMLRSETDPDLRSYAHQALKHQDPSYKAMVDAQARERGIAEGKAKRMQRMMLRAAREENRLTSPT